MIKNFLFLIFILVLTLGLDSCSKKGKSRSGVIDDGQVHGVSPSAKASMAMPLGMVYVPPGTFHMGPSDEDINYTFTSRNREVSIPGFWMDATELTNNKYRQFVNWVRDSTVAVMLGAPYYDTIVHWNQLKNIKYDDPKFRDQLAGTGFFIKVDAQATKPFFNPEKLVFTYTVLKMDEMVKKENKEAFKKNPLKFFDTRKVAVYPDTSVWMRDFSYSYNEPMTKRYFAHPSFGLYPIVGVNWKQATAFCNWRTKYLDTYLEKKKMATESDFRLPSEAEWEYAARGGRTSSMYPWGNYYLRNKKGCLLANFKPGRGNYAEDGGFYTVRVDSYWPNGFGLYNMAGNVSEWTNSYFNEGAYNILHDMSPDLRYDAKEDDPPRMKRKVVRGGSWKDVGYYLQTSTRNYEYQDTAKSYIGFRCVIDLVPRKS